MLGDAWQEKLRSNSDQFQGIYYATATELIQSQGRALPIIYTSIDDGLITPYIGFEAFLSKLI